ncbi:hypothetical protein [Streptomyces sp. ML-6]|uniref:hypothetical protein n=1 Tax=Streptomyces sp. ML-6 TaxID=2982693 RepID=UPI0024BF4D6A|nr:hypothetical protein [Streptomyces sp. ML-6]MDK0519664.1 hypothetical protein [Streptomyces sp. ML-6]
MISAASISVFGAPGRPPSPPPSPGRTRHGLALGLAAASVVPAVVLGGTSASAASVSSATPVSAPESPAADQQSACGDPAASEFPIRTRIHGGRDTYASGGGYGTWFLELTNTTTEPCRAIHPVLVLTDQDRRLTSDQIQLKFSDPARPGTEHRVTWETTDRDEHIGVFGGEDGDDFAGFTVPAGDTLTVQVRMAFTSDTLPGRITANAAIVQRQRAGGDGTTGKQGGDGTTGKQGGDDGAWVGESDDYSFTVVDDSHTGDLDDFDDLDDRYDLDDTGGTDESWPDDTADIDTDADAGDTAEADDDTPRPVEPGRPPAGEDPPELAETGSDLAPLSGLAGAGLLIGAGAMVIRTRRPRRPRP